MGKSFPTDADKIPAQGDFMEAAGIEPAWYSPPKYAISREEWIAKNQDWRRQADLRYAQELLKWGRSL